MIPLPSNAPVRMFVSFRAERRHFPRVLAKTLTLLAMRPDGVCVDVTAGLGGHTQRIAPLLAAGKVIAVDRDVEALPDLGVSRRQLTDPDRGLSFPGAGPLDMRMDRSHSVTAADIVNTMDEGELADRVCPTGEERRARAIAGAMVRARPARDTLHFARPGGQLVRRINRFHPALRTFMALRRAVNHELEELGALLRDVPEAVGSAGRVAAIAFMSVEDRDVKQALRSTVSTTPTSRRKRNEGGRPATAQCNRNRRRILP
jgi:16S rRNA (cytosine1402-N4)-methyltransferase